MSRLRRELGTAWHYTNAPDFWFACAVGAGVAAVAGWCPGLREDNAVLGLTTTIGIAILAVVIASISILTAFLTEDYGILLRSYYGKDLAKLFYPYKLVAFVSCLLIAVSLTGLFVWSVSGTVSRTTVLALTLGLTAWATFGAFDLVRMTAGHGRLKMRLPEIQEAYDKEREKRDAAT